MLKHELNNYVIFPVSGQPTPCTGWVRDGAAVSQPGHASLCDSGVPAG